MRRNETSGRARPAGPAWLAVLLMLAAGSARAAVHQHTYDLVVYGATPSGIAAAVEGARQGLRVALVEPGGHVGGMVASGLGRTDHGDEAVIGGLALEFFQRVGQRYGESVEWNFEPHAASFVFDQMLREAHVDLYLNKPILEQGGVEKQGSAIVALATGGDQLFHAKVFIDASYEGTLMGAAGVSYTWGREAGSRYDESLAGFRGLWGLREKNEDFTTSVSPFTASGALLPGVQPAEETEVGQGDRKLPAYAFRLCITRQDGNKLPFPRPANYRPETYALLSRQIAALTEARGRPPILRELLTLGPLPNGKFDVDDLGAFSTDDIGASWGYPGANAAGRETIRQNHVDYEQGLLYFLGHDSSVPASLREEVNGYGLAKDEFVATGGWPWQLYVRESRRMLGDYVMTQRDVETDLTKSDTIGMGSYAIDSHDAQRTPTPEGLVQDEGGLYVATHPYQMPYRMLLPRPGEASNLLVTVCFSASHVAYSSLRMEPQYMIAGQAAGAAAALVVRGQGDLYTIPLAALQQQLQADHAVLQLPAPAQ